MKSIKDLITALTPDRRKEIMLAFNEERSMTLDLEDGTFLGVHVYVTPQIEVIQQAGFWIQGKVKKC